MSNLRKHALREFKTAGWMDATGKYNDEMQEAICNHVLELITLFSAEGHSGSTAPYAINLFKTLAMFEPITPLTGEDWEWNNISETRGTEVWQNNRCSHVFKDASYHNGQAYNIQGKVFREPNGCCYTSFDSRVLITFPYTPKTEYVDVPGDPDDSANNAQTNQDSKDANTEGWIEP